MQVALSHTSRGGGSYSIFSWIDESYYGLEKNGRDRRAVPFLRSGSPGLVISRGYGRGMPTPSAVPLGFASAFVTTSAGQAGPGGPPPVTP
jgi:hypothetical protein